MPISDEQLAQIQNDNPGVELHVVTSPETGVEVVVRKPSEPEWRRFRSMQADDEQRSGSMRMLSIASAIYPRGADFLAVLAEHPGLAETIGVKVAKIAGMDGTATSRKL